MARSWSWVPRGPNSVFFGAAPLRDTLVLWSIKPLFPVTVCSRRFLRWVVVHLSVPTRIEKIVLKFENSSPVRVVLGGLSPALKNKFFPQLLREGRDGLIFGLLFSENPAWS